MQEASGLTEFAAMWGGGRLLTTQPKDRLSIGRSTVAEYVT